MKQKIEITIPDGVKFADLELTRDQMTGEIAFNWEPIELICQHSGIDSDVFRHQHEDNVANLITVWYAEHLRHGGERNPVVDELLDEIAIEDKLGIPEIRTVKNQ